MRMSELGYVGFVSFELGCLNVERSWLLCVLDIFLAFYVALCCAMTQETKLYEVYTAQQQAVTSTRTPTRSPRTPTRSPRRRRAGNYNESFF